MKKINDLISYDGRILVKADLTDFYNDSINTLETSFIDDDEIEHKCPIKYENLIIIYIDEDGCWFEQTGNKGLEYDTKWFLHTDKIQLNNKTLRNEILENKNK